MKEFVFTGTWSYTCCADSKVEAIKKFSNSSVNEVDHQFDFHDIKEIEKENKE